MLASSTLLVLLSTLLPSSTARHPLASRGSTYPPADVNGPAPLSAWVATYEAAKAAGRIPAIPASSLVNGSPAYPGGTNPGKGGACSWTVAHCFGTYDVVDAPTGMIGAAFDDGPQPASPPLYDFLKSQGQHATHFMIGSRILDNGGIFQQALRDGQHIAIHTWSHPYMTTLTDLQIVGELGWTAQIIADQSGGLIPAFWRPPYGDVDDRVRAIAKEVFGLYTVIWNQDTNDWSLNENGGSFLVGSGPQNDAGLDAELQGFFNGPKSPGLVILEHELTSRSVGGYIRNYAYSVSRGWNSRTIPDLYSVPWYLNADTTSAGVTNRAIGVGQGTHGSSPAPASPSTGTDGTTAAPSAPSTKAVAVIAPQAIASQSFDSVKIVTPTSYGVTVTATSATPLPTSFVSSTSSTTSRSSSSSSATTSTSSATASSTRTASVTTITSMVSVGVAAAQATGLAAVAVPPASGAVAVGSANGWLQAFGAVLLAVML